MLELLDARCACRLRIGFPFYEGIVAVVNPETDTTLESDNWERYPENGPVTVGDSETWVVYTENTIIVLYGNNCSYTSLSTPFRIGKGRLIRQPDKRYTFIPTQAPDATQYIKAAISEGTSWCYALSVSDELTILRPKITDHRAYAAFLYRHPELAYKHRVEDFTVTKQGVIVLKTDGDLYRMELNGSYLSILTNKGVVCKYVYISNNSYLIWTLGRGEERLWISQFEGNRSLRVKGIENIWYEFYYKRPCVQIDGQRFRVHWQTRRGGHLKLLRE